MCTRGVHAREPLRQHLLADEGEVGLRAQRHLEGQVRRLAAHQPDKVVVLAARGAVDHDVADELGVELGGRVEPETRLTVLILEVALRESGEGRMGAGVVGGERNAGRPDCSLQRVHRSKGRCSGGTAKQDEQVGACAYP